MKILFKKTVSLILAVIFAVTSMFFTQIIVSSEDNLTISIISVFKSDDSTISVLFYSHIGTSGKISLVLTDDAASMNPDDIIYLGEKTIEGNGYDVFDIPVNSNILTTGKTYTLMLGTPSGGKITKKFIVSADNENIDYLPIVPGLNASDVISRTAPGFTVTITKDGLPFTDILENNIDVVLKNETLELKYKILLRADCNYDKKVAAADALLALQYSVKKITLDDIIIKAADMDLNGSVTAGDALAILQCAVGKIDVL